MVDLSDGLKNAFNRWDIRIFVLISLLFQVLQILFASRRKRNTSKAFTFFTWSIYLLADWVAGFTLGLLCMSQDNSYIDAALKDNNTMINKTMVDKVPLLSTSKHKFYHGYNGDLLAFWAPFLLLHLGGPDTITAFSVEDNSLWPRHLVGLLFQVGTAVYVVLLSLPHNKLLAPTILMMLAGIIKYFERTYALYSASLDVFRDSILGQEIDAEELPVELVEVFDEKEHLSMVYKAFRLFTSYKGIIVDHRPFKNWNSLNYIFMEIESSKAFRSVDYELSFLYDVLFTKAAIIHTCVGYLLRFLCTSLIMAASLLFFLFNKKHDFISIDVLITYILLGGAISLDILAYIMLILSKWTIVRLKELESRFKFSVPLIVSRIISKGVSTSSEWSGTMMQHSFVKNCLSDHQSCLRRNVDTIGRSFHVDMMKIFDELESTWSEPITDKLKEFIFQHIKKKFDNAQRDNKEYLAKFSRSRGNLVLEEYNIMDEFIKYSIEVRFEKSILMWHIATDICYYTDEGNEDCKEGSLLISNYMLYLLFKRLSMIPSVTSWHLMYRDTRANLKELFLGWPHNITPEPNIIFARQLKDAYNYFLLGPTHKIRTQDESVLGDALVLAKKLKNNEKVAVEKRWKMVSEMWADMLIYAANNCPGIAHAQALSRGGELLTAVGVLFSHYDRGQAAAHLNDYDVKWREN